MAAQLAQTQNSTSGLWAQLFYESVKMGPMAQAYMAWRAAPYMLSGMVSSGAAQVIAATDYSRAATVSIARMTAIMAKLGFVKLVASITSQCVRQDRPDAVAQVSIEMLAAAEMLALTDITNEMVARGDISDATYIARAMADHGHQEFLQMVAKENMPESVKAAKEKVDGAIAWVTGKDKSADNKDVADKIQDSGSKEGKDDEQSKQQGENETAKEQKLESQSAPANLTAASIA